MLRTRVARQVTIARARHRLALDLHVIDNGPGVPNDIRDRIFFPLVSGRDGGTGLGLTLAQSFVQQHDGIIEVRQPAGPHRFPHPDTPAMKPIWIVDDDHSIRWVLEKALARENLPCKAFGVAQDVLNALEHDSPQVLVSDIRMPGMSGIELLRTVKRGIPHCR